MLVLVVVWEMIEAYTSTLLTNTSALGVRGEIRSEAAIKAATANATVVKNPKTFWARTTVECMTAVSFKGLLLSNSIL